MTKGEVANKNVLNRLKIWQLVLLLILVVCGAVLFVGAASGWFSAQKITIESKYNCEDDCDFVKLTASEYEDLVRSGENFLVFVDQGGCVTADRLRGFMTDFMNQKGVKAYKIMFEEMKETGLHDFVKYYPSVVVVSGGVPIGWLRADADEDAGAYNNYDDFVAWMNKYLK